MASHTLLCPLLLGSWSARPWCVLSNWGSQISCFGVAPGLGLTWGYGVPHFGVASTAGVMDSDAFTWRLDLGDGLPRLGAASRVDGLPRDGVAP